MLCSQDSTWQHQEGEKVLQTFSPKWEDLPSLRGCIEITCNVTSHRTFVIWLHTPIPAFTSHDPAGSRFFKWQTAIPGARSLNHALFKSSDFTFSMPGEQCQNLGKIKFAEACHLRHLACSCVYRPSAVKKKTAPQCSRHGLSCKTIWNCILKQKTQTDSVTAAFWASVTAQRFLVAIIIGKRHRNIARSRCHEVDHFDDVYVMVVGLVRRRQCIMWPQSKWQWVGFVATSPTQQSEGGDIDFGEDQGWRCGRWLTDFESKPDSTATSSQLWTKWWRKRSASWRGGNTQGERPAVPRLTSTIWRRTWPFAKCHRWLGQRNRGGASLGSCTARPSNKLWRAMWSQSCTEGHLPWIPNRRKFLQIRYQQQGQWSFSEFHHHSRSRLRSPPEQIPAVSCFFL